MESPSRKEFPQMPIATLCPEHLSWRLSARPDVAYIRIRPQNYISWDYSRES